MATLISTTVNGNLTTTGTSYAAAYRGNANVGGTGEATWHPAGIYSGSTEWFYGTMYRNGSDTYHSNGAIYSVNLLELNNGFRISQGGSNYGVFNSWVRLDGHYGFYAPSHNNAHIYPNNGSYGSWRIAGSRNDWNGIEFDANNGQVVLMVHTNSNISGFHNNSYGWQIRWESGSLYVYKNTYGGGTQATVLDSSNYNSYAPTLTGTGASGTWGINITGNAATATSAVGASNLYLTSLGSGSVNVNNGSSAVYRNENGSGAALAYAPVLHLGGGDTMWQAQGTYGTSGNGTLYFRQGYSGSWGNWLTMLSSANYNSYSPTLTGGGASGTWGINITGNAASASSVAWSNVSSKPGNWLNTTNLIDDVEPSATAQVSGFYQRYQGAGNPTGTWFNYINVRHSNPGNGHGFQIGMSYYDSNLWFRSYQGGTSPTFASWSRALGTQTDPYPSNMNQYVRTTDTVSFGKLDVNFSGSAVNGIGATHTGSISSGQTAQAFSAGWSAYGASFLIAYKQGELSPSDMCHIYNIGGFYMKIYDGSTNRFHRWDDNGSVSINSSSQGSYIFNVTGDIYATADVIAFSDARVKEDVRTVENALDKVTKLRGVTYIKKDEENKKRKMGVIAQEVLEVLPEVVHEDNDGYYGVSYGNIVGVLIEAIKEQQKQIDELKQELKNK